VGLGKGEELVLDRCRQHHGYWFDGGELQRYLTVQTLSTAAGERAREFLQEIFGIQRSSS
jgi:Zn-finger nucleic acid-binding protein